MRSPDIPAEVPRLTREQIEATFRPCCYCGERERFEYGVYRIHHDYSKHPGMEQRRTERMSTSDLIGNVFRDWAKVAK